MRVVKDLKRYGMDVEVSGAKLVHEAWVAARDSWIADMRAWHVQKSRALLNLEGSIVAILQTHFPEEYNELQGFTYG